VATSLGDALELELADPDNLVRTSNRIAEVAEGTGCFALVGASSVGERLASAAVALARNGLHLHRAGTSEPTLIVDGLLVTGASIASTARRLRKEGMTRVIAAVLITTGGAEVGPQVDELIVLEP
jgi:hypothetical protein